MHDSRKHDGRSVRLHRDQVGECSKTRWHVGWRWQRANMQGVDHDIVGAWPAEIGLGAKRSRRHDVQSREHLERGMLPRLHLTRDLRHQVECGGDSATEG